MKSVLISTRPKWVEKICHKIGEDETGRAIYEKRIEVRKSAPKEVPFKAYIYCTYGNPKENYALRKRGKVIGEFICDKVDEYPYDYCDGVDIDDDTILETDIDREDINIYAKGKTLYGWHISDLKIYDKPKELSEFNAVCRYINEDKSCHFRKVMCPYQQFDYNEDGSINIVECSRVIIRPPQSWMRVVDLGERKMRDILFRGKRVDNGKWVEGYYTELPCGSLGATIFSNDDELVCEDTGSYIIKVFTKQHTNYSNSNPLQVIECEKYEVIPKTVGQYTGLTDKNGKKIFEGDIISAVTLDTGEEQRAVIGFGNFIDENNNDEYIGFFIEFDGIKTTITQLSRKECKNRIEIIGNKYDNKEQKK